MTNKIDLREDEKAILELRTLYGSFGYSKYKMNKFEDYETYVQNKDFLSSKNMITFTDTNGKLKALKPDVTLSIINNTKDSDELKKLYYNENVYRVPKDSSNYKEIMQVGLECIGNIDKYNISEVVCLAALSLSKISKQYILKISNLDILTYLIGKLNISENAKRLVYKCIGDKNIHELKEVCENENANLDALSKLIKVIKLDKEPKKVIKELKAIFGEELKEEIEILNVVSNFVDSFAESKIVIDFSTVNDFKYYNGIAFKGYVMGIPTSVVSGGQYGNLMKAMNKNSKAIGFAVYLDELDRLVEDDEKYDVDYLLIYKKSTSTSALSKKVKEIVESGKTIRVEKSIPSTLTYREIIKM